MGRGEHRHRRLIAIHLTDLNFGAGLGLANVGLIEELGPVTHTYATCCLYPAADSPSKRVKAQNRYRSSFAIGRPQFPRAIGIERADQASALDESAHRSLRP